MGRGADFLYQEGLHDYQLKLELKFRVYCILLYTKAEGIKGILLVSYSDIEPLHQNHYG